MTKKNIIGSRVRTARKENKMEQVELAAALDVDFGIKIDQSDISEIERQVRGAKDFELDAIAKILGVTPNWLMGWDE